VTMLFDNLPTQTKPDRVLPPKPGSRDELDEAIEVLAQGFLYHIIHCEISCSAAGLLRTLKANPEITKGNVSAFRRDGLTELLQRRVVFYESKKPVRIGIDKDRVLKLAAETSRKLDAWARREAGEPDLAASETTYANRNSEHVASKD
jgi:hypothetical protein